MSIPNVSNLSTTTKSYVDGANLVTVTPKGKLITENSQSFDERIRNLSGKIKELENQRAPYIKKGKVKKNLTMQQQEALKKIDDSIAERKQTLQGIKDQQKLLNDTIASNAAARKTMIEANRTKAAHNKLVGTKVRNNQQIASIEKTFKTSSGEAILDVSKTESTDGYLKFVTNIQEHMGKGQALSAKEQEFMSKLKTVAGMDKKSDAEVLEFAKKNLTTLRDSRTELKRVEAELAKLESAAVSNAKPATVAVEQTVEETAKPVAAAVEQTVEETAKPVAAAVEQAVEETAKPVAAAVEQAVEETAKPVAAAVEQAVEGAAKPAAEAAEQTAENIAKKGLHGGKLAAVIAGGVALLTAIVVGARKKKAEASAPLNVQG